MRNRVAFVLAVLELILATLIWEIVPSSNVADSLLSSLSTGLVWVTLHWMFDGYQIYPLNYWPPNARSVFLTACATLGLTSLLTLAFGWGNSAFELVEVSVALWITVELLRVFFGFGIQKLVAKKIISNNTLLLESIDHPTDLNVILNGQINHLVRIGISDEAAAISDLRELISQSVDIESFKIVLIDHHIVMDERVFSELTVYFNRLGIEVLGTTNPIANSKPYLHYWSHNVLPVSHFKEPKLDFPNSLFKAIVDYFWALIGLVIFAPLMLFIYLRLKLSGVEKVFIKRKAMGPNLKTFNFYEFSVFKPGIDLVDASILLLTDRNTADDRFSDFGQFLRRHAYEELPLLFAVLRGKMTLVGPRPVNATKADIGDIANQRRLFMRPGMTGLWVLEDASHIRDEELMQLVYAQHWSLGMDFKILFLTVYRMLRGDISKLD